MLHGKQVLGPLDQRMHLFLNRHVEAVQIQITGHSLVYISTYFKGNPCRRMISN